MNFDEKMRHVARSGPLLGEKTKEIIDSRDKSGKKITVLMRAYETGYEIWWFDLEKREFDHIAKYQDSKKFKDIKKSILSGMWW